MSHYLKQYDDYIDCYRNYLIRHLDTKTDEFQTKTDEPSGEDRERAVVACSERSLIELNRTCMRYNSEMSAKDSFEKQSSSSSPQTDYNKSQTTARHCCNNTAEGNTHPASKCRQNLKYVCPTTYQEEKNTFEIKTHRKTGISRMRSFLLRARRRENKPCKEINEVSCANADQYVSKDRMCQIINKNSANMDKVISQPDGSDLSQCNLQSCSCVVCLSVSRSINNLSNVGDTSSDCEGDLDTTLRNQAGPGDLDPDMGSNHDPEKENHITCDEGDPIANMDSVDNQNADTNQDEFVHTTESVQMKIRIAKMTFLLSVSTETDDTKDRADSCQQCQCLDKDSLGDSSGYGSLSHIHTCPTMCPPGMGQCTDSSTSLSGGMSNSTSCHTDMYYNGDYSVDMTDCYSDNDGSDYTTSTLPRAASKTLAKRPPVLNLGSDAYNYPSNDDLDEDHFVTHTLPRSKKSGTKKVQAKAPLTPTLTRSLACKPLSPLSPPATDSAPTKTSSVGRFLFSIGSLRRRKKTSSSSKKSKISPSVSALAEVGVVGAGVAAGAGDREAALDALIASAREIAAMRDTSRSDSDLHKLSVKSTAASPKGGSRGSNLRLRGGVPGDYFGCARIGQLDREFTQIMHVEDSGGLAHDWYYHSRSKHKNNTQSKHLSIGRKKFNMHPKKGIEYLLEHGFLENTPRDIASFLYKGEGLNKTAIGDYLGEKNDFNIDVLREFVQMHEFSDMILVQALRQFLWSFRLPGEAQKIDRMMECFAQRYCDSNPDVFTSTDTCYVLSFSIIMLNTSLHNPSVKEKPDVNRFVSMNRGIHDGGDLPVALLTSIYESIKKEPFKLPEDDGNDLMLTFFNPDKEGWLWKQGGRVKNWKRRWFILKDNCLYYFEYTTDKEPKGIIPLENIHVREVQDPKKSFCFELSSTTNEMIKACKTDSEGKVVEGKHHVYRMSASKAEEKGEWISCIMKSISKDPFYDMLASRRKKAQQTSKSRGSRK